MYIRVLPDFTPYGLMIFLLEHWGCLRGVLLSPHMIETYSICRKRFQVVCPGRQELGCCGR
jgi:hypothetical protein